MVIGQDINRKIATLSFKSKFRRITINKFIKIPAMIEPKIYPKFIIPFVIIL